jgi:hypothetical protein
MLTCKDRGALVYVGLVALNLKQRAPHTLFMTAHLAVIAASFLRNEDTPGLRAGGMQPGLLRRCDRSGLGLSMVYGFAKQSRGHVKIYSELGHGTTVKLYLPRGQKGAGDLDTPATKQSVPRGDGELILIVEDDPSLRSLVVEQLERLGYRTLAAKDARGALELLKQLPTSRCC